MVQIFFVTGSASGVGVGNLQHWRANTVLNTSLTRSVRMPPSSDDPHNVFLTDRSEAVPDKNNITVQGIPEKSESEAESLKACLHVDCTDAVISALGKAGRNTNKTQPMR